MILSVGTMKFDDSALSVKLYKNVLFVFPSLGEAYKAARMIIFGKFFSLYFCLSGVVSKKCDDKKVLIHF